MKINYLNTYRLALNTNKEIKEALIFSEELFEKVCKILDIDKKEVMK